MTQISRIVKIGDTDISSYVEWGPRRAKGAGRRAKTSPIIGGNRAVVWQEGRDPLTLKAGLIFRPDLADQIGEADDVTALIDDLSGDQETDRLYFGRADRFAVVYGSVRDSEIDPAAGGVGIVRETAEFWAEAAELYAATPTAWDDIGELPLTMAEAVENAGNLDAGLFALEIEAEDETALKLDGLDDWIDAGTVDLSGNLLTVHVRMQLGAWPTSGWPALFEYGIIGLTPGSLDVQLDETTNTISAVGVSAGTAYIIASSAGEPISPGDGWHDIVCTYDAAEGEICLYVDGVLVDSADSPAPPALAASQGVRVGKRADGHFADVEIATVAVWQRVLSLAEIEDLTAGDPVSDTDLVLHYDFSEGEGDALTDLSGEGNDGTLTGFADTSAGAGNDPGTSGWMSIGGPAAGLESVVLGMLDDEAEVVASIALSPGLLSAEVLTVDRFGQIRQTYSDDFGSGDRFAYDGFEDGTVAVADGALVIETSSYAGYALAGQWPLKKGGLLVTFTPTETGTGEAFMEASVDGGDSWLEVSKNSRWVDGAENKIYVPQAEGYVEAWIRWRCDGDITSLSIDDLQIVQLRAVSVADVPKIPAGEERVLQITGSGRATISAEWRDRFKP